MHKPEDEIRALLQRYNGLDRPEGTFDSITGYDGAIGVNECGSAKSMIKFPVDGMQTVTAAVLCIATGFCTLDKHMNLLWFYSVISSLTSTFLTPTDER